MVDPWIWLVFCAAIVAMLAIDLVVENRTSGAEPSLQRSAAWSVVWTVVALAFAVVVLVWRGGVHAEEYLTGFLLERSLSLDNLFVFAMLFAYFAVPAASQRKVLFFGIIGAIVLRAIFIFAGAALLDAFHWTIYAFGILLAMVAVFLAIVWLRVDEPDLVRPVRMGMNVRFGRTDLPTSALLGFALAWLSWLLVLGTHRAARVVPPLWLVSGIVVFVLVRRSRGLGVFARYRAVPLPPPEVTEVPYGTIVVPVKQAGPIEEEMLAMAGKLAQTQGARVLALKVVEVPLAESLEAAFGPVEQVAIERLEQLVSTFAKDYGVEFETKVMRARAISSAIADEARRIDAGLILIGAVPHVGSLAGRAQVFSETVENLLRRAPTRVIVTAFPPGTAIPDPDAPPPMAVPVEGGASAASGAARYAP
jgi:nucleotide-binding universal stress UspA family protein